MEMNSKWVLMRHCGHFAICMNKYKKLCCTPETNIVEKKLEDYLDLCFPGH